MVLVTTNDYYCYCEGGGRTVYSGSYWMEGIITKATHTLWRLCAEIVF